MEAVSSSANWNCTTLIVSWRVRQSRLDCGYNPRGISCLLCSITPQLGTLLNSKLVDLMDAFLVVWPHPNNHRKTIKLTSWYSQLEVIILPLKWKINHFIIIPDNKGFSLLAMHWFHLPPDTQVFRAWKGSSLSDGHSSKAQRSPLMS